MGGKVSLRYLGLGFIKASAFFFLSSIIFQKQFSVLFLTSKTVSTLKTQDNQKEKSQNNKGDGLGIQLE